MAQSTAKADFLTAMGGATTLVGATKALSAPNTTTDAMTATGHGRETGFGPVRLANSGGALPTGLAAATNYWLIVVDANTVKFATSEANALAGTAVDITANGSGTHTMSCTYQTLADLLEDALNNFLTAPGNKDCMSDVQAYKFWTNAVLGAAFS